MFRLLWNLSAALCGYLRAYLPINRAVDRLRGPRGLKWAIPVSLIATPSYLFGLSVCATIVERGGPAHVNLLVLLFAWNAIKLAATGVLTPVRWLTVTPGRPAPPRWVDLSAVSRGYLRRVGCGREDRRHPSWPASGGWRRGRAGCDTDHGPACAHST